MDKTREAILREQIAQLQAQRDELAAALRAYYFHELNRSGKNNAAAARLEAARLAFSKAGLPLFVE